MSWLTRILPGVSSQNRRSPIPAGLWTKCPGCDQALYTEELRDSMMVCPKCGHHMRIGARRRLLGFLDRKGPHEEIGAGIVAADPLGFTDSKSYPERLNEARRKSGELDAIVVMEGTLRLEPVVAAAFEFGFMGGSMGGVVGERFVLGVRRSLEKRIPFICFTSSGGARMQEGAFSLMQLAKTNAALGLLSDEAIPFISVLTDPTMGGVSASFAFLGDVVIAEPGALVGFAGPRVIEQTVREKLPEGFQRSEFLFEKGAVDMIVDRRDMRVTVSELISLLARRPSPAV